MTAQPVITPSEVELQEARRTSLRNGIDLYTLPSDDFGVLRISFVFRAGSARQQVPFSASAAANLLSEGSTRMTAQQIAEQLDYYGSWYDVNIDRDYAYINFATLSKFFDQTLDVAGEILLRPAFPEGELRIYAAKRRQRLSIERTKIDVRAREAFARALFGAAHPYGISSDESAYDLLTRDDVVAFHRRHYTAGPTRAPTTSSRATTSWHSTAATTPPKTASSSAAGASDSMRPRPSRRSPNAFRAEGSPYSRTSPHP